jgi:hypothetical protein
MFHVKRLSERGFAYPRVEILGGMFHVKRQVLGHCRDAPWGVSAAGTAVSVGET